ncbi:MAG: cell division protein FtsL [Syntrophaceae bacterium]|nr:cell division protein FtsL [Syntrophaceae bacterium]
MVKTAKGNPGRILWTEEGSKRPRAPMKFNLLLLYSMILAFLVGVSLFYVWSRIQVIQLGYEISNALKEERALAEANKRLRLEIATLKSYPRIEKVAVEELKMVKPKPDQVILIR